MEMILLLGTLAASVVIAVLSTGLPQLAADPGGPGLFPLAAAVVTGAASAALIGQRLFFGAGAASRDRVSVARHLLADMRANLRPLGVVLLVLLFPLGIEWIGFTEAVLLFSFFTLFVSGKSLAMSALTSALIAAGIYIAYALILGAILPEGQLVYQLFY